MTRRQPCSCASSPTRRSSVSVISTGSRKRTRAAGGTPWRSSRSRDSLCQNVPPPRPLPPDGKFTVTTTFKEPGIYVVRALARDRALKTTRDVTVTVTR